MRKPKRIIKAYGPKGRAILAMKEIWAFAGRTPFDAMKLKLALHLEDYSLSKLKSYAYL